MPKVYIVVLNYKNWQDTVECLESLLRLDYNNYQIIVIDNASPNESMHHLAEWAEGKSNYHIQPNDQLKHLSQPTVEKPVSYQLLSLTESFKKQPHTQILILIQSPENRGYSAGNNIGLKYGLAQNDANFFWVLNNDVVVERNSLKTFVEKADYYQQHKQKVGLIGGKMMHYYSPDTIQAAGGCLFNRLISRPSTGLGNFEEDHGQYNKEVAIDFVSGACMLVSKSYIEDVGLLNEEYFLYQEEPDWAERGKRKNWSLGYSWHTVVYHKEGGSTGYDTHRRGKVSFLSDFYYQRNKILFTRNYYPQYLVFVYLTLLMVIFKKAVQGNWNRIPKFISMLFSPTRSF